MKRIRYDNDNDTFLKLQRTRWLKYDVIPHDEVNDFVYEIFDEIQSKKKDWMPDEELDELLGFESFLDDIFFLDIYKPHDYCEFDQVIAGIKEEDNGLGYTIKRTYKIEDFFSQFDFSAASITFKT